MIQCDAFTVTWISENLSLTVYKWLNEQSSQAAMLLKFIESILVGQEWECRFIDLIPQATEISNTHGQNMGGFTIFWWLNGICRICNGQVMNVLWMFMVPPSWKRDSKHNGYIINPYEDGRWGSPLTPCHDHGTTFSSEYMGVQSWDAWGFRMTQLISSMPAPLWRNESPMIVLAAAECHSPCSTTSSHLHVLYCSLWWWFMATTSIMYWDRFAISLHVLDVLDVRLNVVGSIPVFL